KAGDERIEPMATARGRETVHRLVDGAQAGLRAKLAAGIHDERLETRDRAEPGLAIDVRRALGLHRHRDSSTARARPAVACRAMVDRSASQLKASAARRAPSRMRVMSAASVGRASPVRMSTTLSRWTKERGECAARVVITIAPQCIAACTLVLFARTTSSRNPAKDGAWVR